MMIVILELQVSINMCGMMMLTGHKCANKLL